MLTTLKNWFSKSSALPSIRLGDQDFSLTALQGGLGVVGGIGSGKRTYVLAPILKQLLTLCNQEEGEFAKVGGLILDPKNDYLPDIIATFEAVGRPLSDIVLIDSGSKQTYNPINVEDGVAQVADKLTKIQAVYAARGDYQGKQPYLDNVFESVVKANLILLEFCKGTAISCVDILEAFEEDAALEALLQQAQTGVTQDSVSEETRRMVLDAINQLQAQWVSLAPKTKTLIRIYAANVFGAVAKNPQLREVFCASSTVNLESVIGEGRLEFSFKDVINDGKLVVFQAGAMPHSVSLFIQRSLYSDFQTWAKRRNGSAAKEYNLDANRNIIFFSEDFHEIATSEDDTFATVIKACRVIQLLGTQSMAALGSAFISRYRLSSLHLAIRNWIILSCDDPENQEFIKSRPSQGKMTVGDIEAVICKSTSKNFPHYG